jgi:prepilin-type N-terminal cleavage/methylation domain-containing protein
MNKNRIRAKRGFTLIELLVVVSIITLLISLLLPTVGEVRRQARISNCTQNMKQHMLATLSYASANDDELPNGPKSTGGPNFENITGPRGRTAFRMAGEDFELNGFAWGNDGMWTLTSPYGYEVLNRRDLDFWSSMKDMYWVQLAQYLEGGRSGIGALSEIWHSPSDGVTPQDWTDFRNAVRGASGELPETEDAASFIDLQFMSPGSYKYVTPALLTPKVDARGGNGQYFGEYSAYHNQASGPGQRQTPVLGTDPGEFYHFINRNRVGDITYSSQKVLFYMYQPWHNPNLFAWFEDGADTTVALGDGSARNTNPQSDIAPFNPNENAGAPTVVVFDTSDDPSAPSLSRYRCPFYKTAGGIKGRDLR